MPQSLAHAARGAAQWLQDQVSIPLPLKTMTFSSQCPFYATEKWCYKYGITCKHDGHTHADIGVMMNSLNEMVSFSFLVVLFTVYLMAEKHPGEAMLKGDNACLAEINEMIDHYISLKTVISFCTGAAVSVILLLIGIKLAVLFGELLATASIRPFARSKLNFNTSRPLLPLHVTRRTAPAGLMTFMLNYIPNVGSMIAMFLPLPVVLLDPGLKQWQQIMAFAGTRDCSRTPVCVTLAIVFGTQQGPQQQQQQGPRARHVSGTHCTPFAAQGRAPCRATWATCLSRCSSASRST